VCMLQIIKNNKFQRDIMYKYSWKIVPWIKLIIIGIFFFFTSFVVGVVAVLQLGH
jgi:hypothetical protein